MTQPLAATNRDRDLQRGLDLLVLDVMRIRAWERLLFLECGEGWIVEEAWRRALRVYACGFDTSPALVARANELRGVPGKLEFTTWDGQRLPCPDRSFHRLVSTFTLERSADVGGVLTEMRRVLQPGGDLYLLELDRRPGGAADPAALGFATALQDAGFHDVRQLAREELAQGWSEPAAAVIVHARRNGEPAAP